MKLVTQQFEVVYEDGVLRPLQPIAFRENQHLLVTLTDEYPPSPGFNPRRQEQQWIRANGPGFAGQWLAIEGDQLISFGHNAKSVLEEARAKGTRHPLLVQIPPEPPIPFGGW